MINLIKGQRVEIDKGLTQLVVEMGWKVNPNANPPYDLDASTFCLGESGQIEDEYDLTVGQEAYNEYVKEGKKSRPIDELFKECDL